MKGIEFRNVYACGNIDIGDVIIHSKKHTHEELFDMIRASPDYMDCITHLPKVYALNAKAWIHLGTSILILWALSIVSGFHLVDFISESGVWIGVIFFSISSFYFFANLKRYRALIPVTAEEAYVIKEWEYQELDPQSIGKNPSFKIKRKILLQLFVPLNNRNRWEFVVPSHRIVKGDVGIVYIAGENVIGFKYLCNEKLIDGI